MPPSHSPHPAPRARLTIRRKLLFSLLVTSGICLVVECISRWIVENTRRETTAEELHTEYDAQLGWINKSTLSVPNLYGVEKHLTTNSQRLRASHEFTRDVPANKLRLICSGDSFTLGYGVGDQHTWCAQLESLDERVQTVNMGQGGYGVGQAYLWYQRIKNQLDHQVHLFSFISLDFVRATKSEFLGYGKPLLLVESGRLRITNVPVPQPADINRNWLGRSGTLRLLRRFRATSQRRTNADESARKLAVFLFNQLQTEHRQKNRTLVLVHLPLRDDYFRGPDNWRRFLKEQSQLKGWTYIDLLPSFRELPMQEIESLYLGNHLPFAGAAGHYNEKGNRFVAEALITQLLQLPSIRDLYQALVDPQGSGANEYPPSAKPL